MIVSNFASNFRYKTMARVQISLPDFIFETNIAVQIGDINYVNHLANDAILKLCHEARLQFLQKHGYTEMNVDGCGLIMADAMIKFSHQAFYGDILTFRIGIDSIERAGFSLITQIYNQTRAQETAIVKNGMVFFDYQKQSICSTPLAFKQRFRQT